MAKVDHNGPSVDYWLKWAQYKDWAVFGGVGGGGSGLKSAVKFSRLYHALTASWIQQCVRMYAGVGVVS